MNDDYIDPSEATHVRVAIDSHGWMIDAANDGGGYTEDHWTCDWVADEPVCYTRERAMAMAPVFAEHLGLGHLPVKVIDPESEKTRSVYCVTLAGPERHDGEAPYSWVLESDSAEAAVAKAAAAMACDIETSDVELVSVVAGVPPTDCGFHWNDLRGAK